MRTLVLISILLMSILSGCFIRSEQTPVTYNVIYNANGADGGACPIDDTQYSSRDRVSIKGNPNHLTKKGYSFNGWNTLENGEGITYTEGSILIVLHSDIVLYAKWTKAAVYTLTYDSNGATSGTVPVDTTNYLTGDTAVIQSADSSLQKTSYAFSGWNTKTDGAGSTYYANDSIVIGTSNITLYAKWTKNKTYSITYDKNGSDSGTVPVDTASYEYGQNATVIDNIGNLKLAGKFFKNWNTKTDGSGTAYTKGQTLKMTSDITLYAQWSDMFKVTYVSDMNSTKLSMAAPIGNPPVDVLSYYFNDTATILGKGGLVNDGAIFNDWNTEPDGTGTPYTQGTEVQISGDLTLYAQWYDQYMQIQNLSDGVRVSGTTGRPTGNRSLCIPTYYKTLPVTIIDFYSFQNDTCFCNVILPETITKIEDNTFKGSSVRQVLFSNHMTYIGKYAFAYSALDTIVMAAPFAIEKLTIAEGAFCGCTKLSTCNITFNSNTTLMPSVFKNCTSLTSLPIIEGPIPASAFYGCTGLRNITIDSQVPSIGANAFANCSSLGQAIIYGNTPPVLEYEFVKGMFVSAFTPDVYSSEFKIWIYGTTLDDYLNDYAWSQYSSYLELAP